MLGENHERAHRAMYKILLQRLNQLVLLNPQQQKELCKVVQAVELPKDKFLLEKGQLSNHIYFVVEGAIRSFCEANDKEVTRWFCFEGHFATSYFSFVYRQPSEDSLILIKDSKLLSISYGDLQNLAHKDAVWVDLNRRLLEYYYTNLLNRAMSFQTQSAAERYNNLLQEQSDIEDIVSLGHLASYLGMTQETLSRLRARKKRRRSHHLSLD
ncbi:MAG: Crp/Fnr family transcriptional regulator [Pseudanabaenales cyanobacterium]|nr:Crp/Fnr family transcriptional regulator [Pseudanabaenales cyanobacterium]